MNTEKPQVVSIAEALAKAQGEFGHIRRDREVEVVPRKRADGYQPRPYKFCYAPLESILKATLPALSKNGIALTQGVVENHVVTKLLSATGELSNRIPIMVKEDGPQAYGSGLTYSRRYGVTLILGICADDDDDANLAEGNEVKGNGKHPEPPQEVIATAEGTPVGDEFVPSGKHQGKKWEEVANDYLYAITQGKKASPEFKAMCQKEIDRRTALMQGDQPIPETDEDIPF